ncbi:MAG: hypothetical protein C4584_00160, partial [Armatimonadetes bacterium]
NVQGAWNFDETASPATDSSGNSHTGTWTGSTTYAAGKFGNALSLPGNDSSYASVATPSTLNFSAPASIEFWLKDNTDSGQIALSFTQAASGSEGHLIYVGGITGYCDNELITSYHFSTNDGNTALNCYNTATRTELFDNNWHHIVMTYDGSDTKIYLDGQSKTITTGLGTDAGHFGNLGGIDDISWGSRIMSSTRSMHLTGQLDNARIYDKTLSQAEISDLYGTGGDRQGYTTTNYANKELVRKYSADVTVGSPADNHEESWTKGPVAYWSFDSGQGQTAQDLTSNNNDGTLGADSSVASDDPSWISEDLCVSGKCLKFDGTDDYVNVSNTINSVQTVSFWTKPSSNTVSLIDFDGGTHYISASSGTVSATGFTSPTIYVNGVSGGTLTANSWNHIEVTTGTSFNATAITIGKEGANYIKGFIDEPKIYNYARSAAQAKADYNSRGGSKGTSAQIGSPSTSSGRLSEGLIGYWKMDESSANSCTGGVNDSCDSSGNGNDGAWNGNATSAAGKYGNGVTFDSAGDFISITNSSSLQLDNTQGDGISLSVWFKADSYPQADNPIISKMNTSPWNVNYQIDLLNDGTLKIVSWDGSQNNNIGNISGINLGQWYHLVFVMTSSKYYYYLDGFLSSSGNNPFNLYTSVHYNMRIGQDMSTNHFDGTVDNLRVYNRALTPSEVEDLYNFAPGPVLHLKMDDSVNGDSKTLVDSSSYGNNGSTVDGANNTGMDCTKPGKYGKGCEFDGTDDYVTKAKNSDFNIGQGTISAWAKVSNFSDYHEIVSFWDGSANGDNGTFVDFTNDNKIRIGTGISGSWSWLATTDNTFSANTWYYITLTVNSSGNKLYVNGVQQSLTYTNGNSSSSTFFDDIYSSASSIDIGRANIVNYPSYFDGSIDDVKIYNYARSAKQIIQDMTGGASSVSSSGSTRGSMLSYYDFDEGYGQTINNSGNGGSTLNGTRGANSGSSTDDPSWTNSGKFGKALSFDGGDYVDVGEGSGNFDSSLTGLTISAWVNPSSLAGYPGIVGKGNADSNSSGSFLFYLGGGGSGSGTISFLDYSGSARVDNVVGPALSTNTWTHVVATWQAGTGAYIYVNGKQRASDTSSVASSIDDTAYNLIIGSNEGNSSNKTAYPFNGSIDEVKIYNYALTKDEILADYNHGSSLIMGSISTDSDGSTASFADSRGYCIPGDTSTCNSPVAEWNFEEGSGGTVNDTSGNGNTGTWYGTGAKHWDTGKVGKAGKFNGSDDYVNIGDKDVLEPTTNGFSISTWAKAATWPSDIQNFVAKYSTQVSGQYYLGVYQNKVRGLIVGNGDVYKISNSSSTLTDGQWAHIVMTWTGVSTDSVLIYVNGKLDSSTSTNNTITAFSANAEPTFIGVRNNSAKEAYFNGQIDEVKIFNYARSAAQIAWDYNRGATVGYWDFDECQGNQVQDLSENGNHGTITIGASGEDTLGTCSTSSTAWGDGATGKYNSSLKFDGTDDYVTIPSGYTNTLKGKTTYSVSLWFKANTINTDVLVDASGSGSNGFYLQQNSTNGFYWSSGSYRTYTGMSLTTSRWYHIALVKTADGDNGTLYLDGIPQTSYSGTLGTTPNSDYDLLIGKFESANYEFNGQIDDVKIFNYALTGTQVKNLYNENSAVRFGPNAGSP